MKSQHWIRLNHCNQLYAGISGQLLQSIQNITARLITEASSLRELHWLPVQQQIRLKTVLIVLKYLYLYGIVISASASQ